MTSEKKSTLQFYLFVGFVSIVLSLWIIFAMSIKSEQNGVLQNQIDSLIYATHISHQPDNTLVNIEDYLPKQKISRSDQTQRNIIFHFIGLLIIGGLVLLYIRFNRIKRSGCIKKEKKE